MLTRTAATEHGIIEDFKANLGYLDDHSYSASPHFGKREILLDIELNTQEQVNLVIDTKNGVHFSHVLAISEKHLSKLS